MTHWDISFWSERLRESKYDINEVGRLPLNLYLCSLSDFSAVKVWIYLGWHVFFMCVKGSFLVQHDEAQLGFGLVKY